MSFDFQQVVNKYLKGHLEVFELLFYWFAAEIHGLIILAAGVCGSEGLSGLKTSSVQEDAWLLEVIVFVSIHLLYVSKI